MNKLKPMYLLGLLGFILLGLGAAYYGELIKTTYSTLSSVLSNLSVALIITGLFGLINEFIIKNAMLELIISKVQLKNAIEQTGLDDISFDWKTIPYRKFFESTKGQLDIVNAYGSTWTNSWEDELVTVLTNTECNIRVILLDPNSTTMIPAFADQYGILDEELKNKIIGVTKKWKRIYERSGINDPSRLKIYYHSGVQTIALYRFDNTIVSTLLRITKKPATAFRFPSLICSKTDRLSDLFSIYIHEIEDLLLESREVSLNSINA